MEERHTQSYTGTDQRAHIPERVVDRAVLGSVLGVAQLRQQQGGTGLFGSGSVFRAVIAYWSCQDTNLRNTKPEAKNQAADHEQGYVEANGDQCNSTKHDRATEDDADPTTPDVDDIRDNGHRENATDEHD